MYFHHRITFINLKLLVKVKKEVKKMVKKKDEKSDKEKTKNYDTLKITSERDIALDFASKVYKEFDKIIKSVVLFGSSAKKISTPDSDIDIIIIIDDVSIRWDQELIAWYREELGGLIRGNPYKKSLHINTVKLSAWWGDLTRGDPVIVNILRYGEPLIDFGGFFTPLKVLLQEGKIRSTPESIYTLLQRAPVHMARARAGLLSVVDGLYWACVDSAHAALIAAKIMPPSPEHISEILKEEFVDKKMLKQKYADYYLQIHQIAKEIIHGKKIEIKGRDVDELTAITDEFVGEMARIVDELVEKK